MRGEGRLAAEFDALRNQRFFSLSELNAAIAKLVVDLNDYHVDIDSHYYSVPYRLLKDRLPSQPYVYAELAAAPSRSRLMLEHRSAVVGFEGVHPFRPYTGRA
jgi:hypothetical protein